MMRLGLDIGGTKVHAVVIDEASTIVAEVRIPTGRGPHEVVSSARAAILQLSRGLGISTESFVSLGIGIPGGVDPSTGVVSNAVNLGITKLDLAHELRSTFPGWITVENDVNAAALGAYHGYIDQSIESMAYLNTGTGVAAGLILNRRIWRGHRGVAGEIGHIPIDSDGVRCACGQTGCLETIASGSAVARWRSESTVRELARAAGEGDPAAVRARDCLIGGIATAVQVLILTVGVDVVMIGGGIATLGQDLLNLLVTDLENRSARSDFLASLEMDKRVQILPPGSSAAAIGAALVASHASAHPFEALS
jgi:glucokinase